MERSGQGDRTLRQVAWHRNRTVPEGAGFRKRTVVQGPGRKDRTVHGQAGRRDRTVYGMAGQGTGQSVDGAGLKDRSVRGEGREKGEVSLWREQVGTTGQFVDESGRRDMTGHVGGKAGNPDSVCSGQGGGT